MFDEVSNAFAGFVKKVNARAPEVLGQYGPILSNALARGNDDLLLTHVVLSKKDPGYRDAMASAGLRYDEPGHQVDQRAAAMAALRQHLQQRDADVAKQMEAFLAGRSLQKPGTAGSLKNPLDEDGIAHRDRLQAFTARAKELEQLATDPDALTQRIGAAIGPLQHTAPTTAQALAATATKAVGFLSSKVPKPPPSSMPGVPALQSTWQPSDAEIAKYERYAAAINDPTSVFEDLRHGTVTREAVEALQAVYPSYYADMRGRARQARRPREAARVPSAPRTRRAPRDGAHAFCRSPGNRADPTDAPGGPGQASAPLERTDQAAAVDDRLTADGSARDEVRVRSTGCADFSCFPRWPWLGACRRSTWPTRPKAADAPANA
jgi:hypothetical protein